MVMAKKLKYYLEEKRFSVAELSRRSGVPAKTIYHWLNGQQPRKMDHLFAVADTLGISIDELYGRAPKAPNPLQMNEMNIGKYEVILRPLDSTSET